MRLGAMELMPADRYRGGLPPRPSPPPRCLLLRRPDIRKYRGTLRHRRAGSLAYVWASSSGRHVLRRPAESRLGTDRISDFLRWGPRQIRIGDVEIHDAVKDGPQLHSEKGAVAIGLGARVKAALDRLYKGGKRDAPCTWRVPGCCGAPVTR